MRDLFLLGDYDYRDIEKLRQEFSPAVEVLKSESNIKYSIAGNIYALAKESDAAIIRECFMGLEIFYPDVRLESDKGPISQDLANIFYDIPADDIRENLQDLTMAFELVIQLEESDKLIVMSDIPYSAEILKEASINSMIHRMIKMKYLRCSVKFMKVADAARRIKYLPGRRKFCYDMTKQEQIDTFGKSLRKFAEEQRVFNSTNEYNYKGAPKWLGIFLDKDTVSYFRGVGLDVIGTFRSYSGLKVPRYLASEKDRKYRTLDVDFDRLKEETLSGKNKKAVEHMSALYISLLNSLTREAKHELFCGDSLSSILIDTISELVLAMDISKCYDIVLFIGNPIAEEELRAGLVRALLMSDLNKYFDYKIHECYLY